MKCNPIFREDQNKNRISQDISRLNPRAEINTKLPTPKQTTTQDKFGGSRILAELNKCVGGSTDYSHILGSWVAAATSPSQSSVKWTVLFRASDHHFSAEAFHRVCDGAAPSVVLVKADTGKVARSRVSCVSYMIHYILLVAAPSQNCIDFQ